MWNLINKILAWLCLIVCFLAIAFPVGTICYYNYRAVKDNLFTHAGLWEQLEMCGYRMDILLVAFGSMIIGTMLVCIFFPLGYYIESKCSGT